MKRRGRFIVIDGCEGAGKTTMIEKLIAARPELQIFVTHEPGGTPLAEKIRKIFLSPAAKGAPVETSFSLVWASRADNLRRTILPSLCEGRSVISDRFDSSTFAYQIYAQKGRHLEKLFWETRKLFLAGAEPDCYIFFDVEPAEGLRRIATRKKNNHFDEETLAFHRLVREGYFAFLKKVPHKIIDANKGKGEVEREFERAIMSVIDG